MGLADRLVHSDNPPPNVTTEPIGIHEWTAAFELYCYGEATRTSIINQFGLSTEEQNGLDVLKSNYDALSTALDKHIFLHKLEATGLFYQNGMIDIAKYKSIMGLT